MTRIPTAENATIHKTVVADTTGSPSAAGASLVSVSYTNLVNFSSENPSSSQQSLIDAIGDAFGADGLGILLVTDVPDFEEQRRLLLPLAAQLPYVDDLERCVHPESLYSTGWSHGKECLQQQIADGDGSTTVVVPDTSKGSFYANPLTNDLTASCMARDRDRRDKGSPGDDEARDQHWKSLAQAHPEFFAANLWPTNSMPQLELAFMTMGRTIHRVGCLLAAACDAYCHQQSSGVVELKLQETLQRSLNAKGRLLHYFEVSSNNERGDNAKTASNEMSETMWCGWHNDHGSLTGLVPAMYFRSSDGQELPRCPDSDAGLYIQSRTGQLVKASLPLHACAFQIGETSQIQSGGLLQATPHAVRPPRQAGVTRETFALFMEPEFEEGLQIPPGKTLEDVQDASVPLPSGVLPLKARWKPGQSFGEFHKATVSAFTTS